MTTATPPTTNAATSNPGTAVLRPPIAADAVVSGLFGAALVAAPAAVADLTGLGTGWLRGIGAFALLYAVDLAILATRLPRGGGLVRWVAVGNAVWVGASLLLAAAGDLTAAGRALVVLQAALVAGLAVMQWRAAARTTG